MCSVGAGGAYCYSPVLKGSVRVGSLLLFAVAVAVMTCRRRRRHLETHGCRGQTKNTVNSTILNDRRRNRRWGSTYGCVSVYAFVEGGGGEGSWLFMGPWLGYSKLFSFERNPVYGEGIGPA